MSASEPGTCVSSALSAVISEQRAASERLTLHADGVQIVREREPMIAALQVKELPPSDWTWEGARAWAMDSDAEPTEWEGEVVEVDPLRRLLYVRADCSEEQPTPGIFSAQPFDFLEALRTIYESTLADRLEPKLALCAGTRRPAATSAPARSKLLTGIWEHEVGQLWGPPAPARPICSASKWRSASPRARRGSS